MDEHLVLAKSSSFTGRSATLEESAPENAEVAQAISPIRKIIPQRENEVDRHPGLSGPHPCKDRYEEAVGGSGTFCQGHVALSWNMMVSIVPF